MSDFKWVYCDLPDFEWGPNAIVEGDNIVVRDYGTAEEVARFVVTEDDARNGSLSLPTDTLEERVTYRITVERPERN